MTDTGGREPTEQTTAADRRRHKRVAVSLPGRYMLEDGTEYPCVCTDISVGGVRLQAAQAGPWGSRVVAYIDGIGRIEGYIIRRAIGWFALESRVTSRKGERVQERIAWIAGAETAEISDRRGRDREPARRQSSLYTLDGREHVAQITDISREGAAMLTEAPLGVDEKVRLDSRRARVVRVFPGGVALKFENWVDESWPRREGPAPEPQEPRWRRA